MSKVVHEQTMCHSCGDSLDNYLDIEECDDCCKKYCPPCAGDGVHGGNGIGEHRFTCHNCEESMLEVECARLAERVEKLEAVAETGRHIEANEVPSDAQWKAFKQALKGVGK